MDEHKQNNNNNNITTTLAVRPIKLRKRKVKSLNWDLFKIHWTKIALKLLNKSTYFTLTPRTQQAMTTFWEQIRRLVDLDYVPKDVYIQLWGARYHRSLL